MAESTCPEHNDCGGPDRDHRLRAVTESRLILTDERRLSKKTGFRVEAHLCRGEIVQFSKIPCTIV